MLLVTTMSLIVVLQQCQTKTDAWLSICNFKANGNFSQKLKVMIDARSLDEVPDFTLTSMITLYQNMLINGYLDSYTWFRIINLPD